MPISNSESVKSREVTAVEVLAAVSRGVRAALLMHKQAGNPVAEWRDGRVVLVSDDKIVGT